MQARGSTTEGATMTEEQLKTFRADCRALAYKSACGVLLRTLEAVQPTARQSLARKANQARDEYLKIVLADRNASESDMLAAEFQEAFDEMIQQLFGPESQL